MFVDLYYVFFSGSFIFLLQNKLQSKKQNEHIQKYNRHKHIQFIINVK